MMRMTLRMKIIKMMEEIQINKIRSSDLNKFKTIIDRKHQEEAEQHLLSFKKL